MSSAKTHRDDDALNGLIKYWTEVERLCRRHDEKRKGMLLATTQPASGNHNKMASDGAQPLKEESSLRKILAVFDVEALVQEVYEIMKAKIDNKERTDTRSDSGKSEEDEEVESSGAKDGAYADAEGAYNGGMGGAKE